MQNLRQLMYPLPRNLGRFAAQTLSGGGGVAFATTIANSRGHYDGGLRVRYPLYHALILLHFQWQPLGSSVHIVAASIIVKVEFIERHYFRMSTNYDPGYIERRKIFIRFGYNFLIEFVSVIMVATIGRCHRHHRSWLPLI